MLYATTRFTLLHKSAHDLSVVFCQADKRVICDPKTANATNTCRTKGDSKAIARCDFSNALWLQGPTCIAGHVHDLPVILKPPSA